MVFRNIIFDLGAVIIDINYNLTAEAFKKLGLVNFDDIYSKKSQSDIFDRFEKGILPEDEFRNELKSFLKGPVTSEQIDAAWNAMLIGIPQSRYDWLATTGRKHRIFLLSNTNTIHVNAFSKLIEKDYGIRKFESLFEKVYYSCFMGMRKPDIEIFEHVLRDNNLSPHQTLFIDDSIQHIIGARAAGLHTMHLTEGKTVEELNF